MPKSKKKNQAQHGGFWAPPNLNVHNQMSLHGRNNLPTWCKWSNRPEANEPLPGNPLQMNLPVPDPTPNWDEWDRHQVMMSVTMKTVPDDLEKNYVAVICPVAKRRIVVSNAGWTCSYNKLTALDRKFQSSLPGGNIHMLQMMKDTDFCVLDCLHLKAERTFYMLDIMHWKYQPHYDSDAAFRFHWIKQIVQEFDLETISPENEYKFKALPRFPPHRDELFPALRDCPFKVDGVLFFHVDGNYNPGTSPCVLWLEPRRIADMLGWEPPSNVLPQKIQQKQWSEVDDDEANGGSTSSSFHYWY